MSPQKRPYDVLIAGQGASALAAAMYAARYQIMPIVIGEIFGGETATGGLIENYPGYVGIEGFELMMHFREQVMQYKVPIVDDRVVKITRSGHCFEATTTTGDMYQASSIIFAVGRERRKLGLEHEDEWTGKGISYCSTCDAPLHRNNTVAVVGGGDAAIKGSILLSKYAEKVYVIYRRDQFTRPEPINLKRLSDAPNIYCLFSTNVIGLKGINGLTSVILDKPYDDSLELEVAGLFLEIGADPRIELTNPLGIALNAQREIMVNRHMQTNVEGFFAAGDVTDSSGELKQTITAASQGAIAATSAYAYVTKHPGICSVHAMGYTIK